MNEQTQNRRNEQERARMLDLSSWFGFARMREHQLEDMLGRPGLSPEQHTKVVSLLRRLRAEIRLKLEKVNGKDLPLIQ